MAQNYDLEHEPLKKKITDLFKRQRLPVEMLDRLSGGWFSILRHSANRFLAMRGTEAAASLAYYALFSLFPLTLFLAALLGYFVKSDVAYENAIAFIRTVFPFSGDLVQKDLQEVFRQRGTFGLLGIIGLLWAASGFFTILARHINLAWPKVKLHGFVSSRLVALSMVGGLILLLLFSILSTAVINYLPYLLYRFGTQDAIVNSTAWLVGLRLVSAAFTMMMFVAMYRWVPNKTVRWNAALSGALFSTAIWELAKLLFSFYLGSGLARFQSVYGSLGALIALLVWIYFSNVIALFGAYLTATMDLNADQKQAETGQEAVPLMRPVETESKPAKELHG